MSIELSANDLTAIVTQWSKSADGMAHFEKLSEDAIRAAIEKGEKIGSTVSKKEMLKLAKEMINTLKSTASGMDLPASVMKHFNSLTHTQPYFKKGVGYVVDIYFADDLSRMSLYDEKYPGGLVDIIALYNNGYDARNHVYGWWDGHSEDERTGPDVGYRSGYGSTSLWIPSRTHLDAHRFIQTAASRFLEKNGEKYNVGIEIGYPYSRDNTSTIT